MLFYLLISMMPNALLYSIANFLFSYGTLVVHNKQMRVEAVEYFTKIKIHPVSVRR